MPLQVPWTNQSTHISTPAAYARIIAISMDEQREVIDVTVGLYASLDAFNSGAAPFDTIHAWPSYASVTELLVSVRGASYSFMKTSVPEFAGATDVP